MLASSLSKGYRNTGSPASGAFQAGGAVRAVDLALHLVLILHPRRTGRYKIGQTAVCRVVSLRITRGCHFHLSLLFEVRVVAKWLVGDQLLLSEEQGAAFATGEDFRRDEFFHLKL